ncbi:MAG: hypothetical protein KatS3mg087_1211 [Patescibacteria group bacterium]|nr:MAG: hypothetical protein KatS3mg087_1211 [Patescibacteria group bacterium]
MRFVFFDMPFAFFENEAFSETIFIKTFFVIHSLFGKMQMVLTLKLGVGAYIIGISKK